MVLKPAMSAAAKTTPAIGRTYFVFGMGEDKIGHDYKVH